jgi:hypothetical protein
MAALRVAPSHERFSNAGRHRLTRLVLNTLQDYPIVECDVFLRLAADLVES